MIDESQAMAISKRPDKPGKQALRKERRESKVAEKAQVAASVNAAAKAWDIAAAERVDRGDELLEMDVFAPEQAWGSRLVERQVGIHLNASHHE